MNLSTKSVAWHLGSVAAGAWGMAVFAQTNAVDLYALIGQLKKTWGDIVVLGTMAAPFIAAGMSAYRTWGAKQVPKDAVAIAPLPGDTTAAPPKGETVAIAGKVVGAFLLAGLFLLPMAAQAQPAKVSTDPLAPILTKLIADAQAASADAHQHNDEIAYQCYDAITALAQDRLAQTNAGVIGPISLMQKARDIGKLSSSPQGTKLIIGCAALVQDARMNILQFMTSIGAATLVKGILVP